ncbi:MAG: GGDEF domain-containing protein [Dactylosporangium sp.]|nr:GGDEF domain-containing protein [Dactylosporangium sp.]NNJ60499.1 GGDEF domain-containing protein [Dactylosporangium sp.]
MATRSVALVSFLLAAVLVALGLTAAWSIATVNRSTETTAEATAALEAIAHLQRAVAGEAFAEAGYRRAPSAEARKRVETAITEVDRAVREASEVGNADDRIMLSYLQSVNDRYVAEVRRSLDDTDTGAPRNDRVAGPALDAIQELIDAAVRDHQRQVAVTRQQQRELLFQLAMVVISVLASSVATLVLCWSLLISHNRRLAAQAAEHERRSLHDALTGLANRDLLFRTIEKAFRAPNAAFSLLYIDLDHFKNINDTHGHPAGDRFLVEVARRVHASVRTTDLVARIGGDEFAVLSSTAADARQLACRIVAAVQSPIALDGTEVIPSLSVGIAVAPDDGRDCSALLHAADRALYLAKHAGRGRITGLRR